MRDTYSEILDAVRAYGEQYGQRQFDGQYLPGGGRYTSRTEREDAACMLRTIDDGRHDAPMPPAWLSGEWAGDPTWGYHLRVVRQSVTPDVWDPFWDGLSDDDADELRSELANEFCMAADLGWQTALQLQLLSVVERGEVAR